MFIVCVCVYIYCCYRVEQTRYLYRIASPKWKVFPNTHTHIHKALSRILGYKFTIQFFVHLHLFKHKVHGMCDRHKVCVPFNYMQLPHRNSVQFRLINAWFSAPYAPIQLLTSHQTYNVHDHATKNRYTTLSCIHLLTQSAFSSTRRHSPTVARV